MNRFLAEAALNRHLVLQVNPQRIQWFARAADKTLRRAELQAQGQSQGPKHKAASEHRLARAWRKATTKPLQAMEWDGDWDRGSALCPVEDDPTYLRLRELSDYRADFRASSFYQEARARIEAGRPMGYKGEKIRTVQALDELVEEQLLGLIESMEAEGFRLKRWHDVKSPIAVMIARDGSLLKKPNGRHRFAAARIAGLTRIPVKVNRVHRRWLERVGGGWYGRGARNLRAALREVQEQYTHDGQEDRLESDYPAA